MVAQVRSLVETTILPHRVIAERTRVDKGTISRWTAKYGWTRPPGACRANKPGEERLPVPRGRELARRIYLQAEGLIVDVTSAPKVDPAALREALRLLEEARAAQRAFRGKRSPPPPATAAARKARRNARLKAKREATRAERAAAREDARLFGRPLTKRERHYAWMLEKIEE